MSLLRHASDVAMWTSVGSSKATSPARSCPTRKTTQQSSRSARVAELPPRRIAHWDKKRDKCQNCKRIYLKTLSLHAGYCSVDCKSNALYLENVNRTIKAVRNAVEQMQNQQEEDAHVAAPVVVHAAEAEADPACECAQGEKKTRMSTSRHAAAVPVSVPRAVAMGEAHTFAEYSLQSRLQEQQHSIEWAFSAIY